MASNGSLLSIMASNGSMLWRVMDLYIYIYMHVNINLIHSNNSSFKHKNCLLSMNIQFGCPPVRNTIPLRNGQHLYAHLKTGLHFLTINQNIEISSVQSGCFCGLPDIPNACCVTGYMMDALHHSSVFTRSTSTICDPPSLCTTWCTLKDHILYGI